MKRSEALDIIDDVLYEHECPLLQGISLEILGRLEKAGMLPPSYIVNFNMEKINPVAVPSEPTYLIERRWEPEDET